MRQIKPKPCKVCGIDTLNRKRKVAVCSEDCSKALWRKYQRKCRGTPYKIICPHCGKTVKRSIKKKITQIIYCSKKCSKESAKIKSKEVMAEMYKKRQARNNEFKSLPESDKAELMEELRKDIMDENIEEEKL